MIVKKIPNKKAGSTKAVRVAGVANYIVEPERQNGMEKCIHHEADNFLTDTHEGHVAEMIALAQDAVRSKDPIDHWVLSWPPTERPTVAQVREAVKIFVGHCGLTGHQVIWGLHDDTENLHVHVAVNRVHPDTLKVIEINKGFQLNAAHQAVAIIEKKQGWKSVENARYKTNEKCELLTDKKTKLPAINKAKDKPLEPTGPAQDMEIQTGQKSAQRIGIEHAAPIIASATSWKELHANMAAAGMQYQRKGSGAIVQVGDELVKASDVSRTASLSALQKRFGPYQPPTEINKNDYFNTSRNFTSANAKKQNATPLGKNTRHGLRNLSKCTLAHSEKSKQAGGPRVLQLDASPDRRTISGLRRNTGRGAEAGDTRNRGQGIGVAAANGRDSTERNAKLFRQPLNTNQPGWTQYIQIRDDQKAAKTHGTIELQKRHEAERKALQAKLKAEREKALAGSWKGKGPKRNEAQSVLATQQAAEKLELSEQQKAERKALQARFKPLPMYKQWKEQPLILCEDLQQELQITRAQQPPKLSQILKSLTHSTDMRGHVTYAQHGKSVFRDEGRTIQVLDLKSDDGIAAALATAQQKFGNVLTLTGSPEFQQNAVAVAVANNLTCRFADPALDALRDRLQADKYKAEREVIRTPEKVTQSPPPPGEAVAPALTPSNKTAQRGIDPAVAEPTQEQQMQRAKAAMAVVKEAKSPVPAPEAQQPDAHDDYDPGQSYDGDEHVTEIDYLDDIHKQIAAAQAAASEQSSLRHAMTQGADYDAADSGVIVGSNEQFVALESGKVVMLYQALELTKNLTYDGTDTGPGRFALGNELTRKNSKDGMRTLLTEEREAMQTEVRRARAQDKKFGR